MATLLAHNQACTKASLITTSCYEIYIEMTLHATVVLRSVSITDDNTQELI